MRSLRLNRIQLAGCLAVVIGAVFFAWFATVNQDSTKSSANTKIATVYGTAVALGVLFWKRVRDSPGPLGLACRAATFASRSRRPVVTLMACVTSSSTPRSDPAGERGWSKPSVVPWCRLEVSTANAGAKHRTSIEKAMVSASGEDCPLDRGQGMALVVAETPSCEPRGFESAFKPPRDFQRR